MFGPASHVASTQRRRALALYLLLSLVGFSVLSGGIASAHGTNARAVEGHLQLNQFSLASSVTTDPPLACGFNVSFYGYAVGTEHATIVVTPTAPTLGGTPILLRAIWTTYTRTSTNELDQNVVVSSAALAGAFAQASLGAQGYHAMISIQVSNTHSSRLTFHTVWIGSCATNLSASPALGSSSSSTSASANTSATPSTPVASPFGLLIATSERVGGTNAAFSAGPVRVELGQQLQLLTTIVNTGTTPLTVQMANPSCDYLTLTPPSPQIIAGGTSLTFFCSHVLFVVPPGQLFKDVATASVVSASGLTLSSVSTHTTALVVAPRLVVGTSTK